MKLLFTAAILFCGFALNATAGNTVSYSTVREVYYTNTEGPLYHNLFCFKVQSAATPTLPGYNSGNCGAEGGFYIDMDVDPNAKTKIAIILACFTNRTKIWIGGKGVGVANGCWEEVARIDTEQIP